MLAAISCRSERGSSAGCSCSHTYQFAASVETTRCRVERGLYQVGSLIFAGRANEVTKHANRLEVSLPLYDEIKISEGIDRRTLLVHLTRMIAKLMPLRMAGKAEGIAKWVGPSIFRARWPRTWMKGGICLKSSAALLNYSLKDFRANPTPFSGTEPRAARFRRIQHRLPSPTFTI
jgi:hypothetical protein